MLRPKVLAPDAELWVQHHTARDFIDINHALPSSARAARTPLPCADLGEPLSLPDDNRPPSLPAEGC